MDANIRTRCREDEQGVVLIVFAMIIFTTMAIFAMVVDHSKQSLSLTTLQRAADAAALSGAKQFNGTRKGWQEAKLAAIAALKLNSIHGVNALELAELRLDEGTAKYDSSLAKHPGSRGTKAGLEVQVERGVLWYDQRLDSDATRSDSGEAQGGYRFVSLEESIDDEDLHIPQGLNGFVISNAVRVKLNLKSLATTFGRVLRVSAFTDLERSAIAVTHEELELPVAPIAIPLCALQLNTDPFADEDSHTTPDIDLSIQCTRQGIATEADPLRELPEVFGSVEKIVETNEILRRREGFTRYATYPRPPYVDYPLAKGPSSCFSESPGRPAHNCKNILLNGVMGVPTLEAGKGASAKDVTNAFQAGSMARLGMYFAPLTNLKEFDANPGYRQVIADVLNDPSPLNRHNRSFTFREIFTDANGLAKRNFPSIRTPQPPAGSFDPEYQRSTVSETYDLSIYWPTKYKNFDGEQANEKLIMDIVDGRYSRRPLDYTSAMCHDPAIPVNALTTTNPDRHRVRRVLAPIIAPGTAKKPNGKPAMYCDYQEVFENYSETGESTSVAPVPKSLPVIVGFLPIYLYDFNLQDLDRVPAFAPPAGIRVKLFDRTDVLSSGATLPPNEWASTATPRYRDPVTGAQVEDRSPGSLDVVNSFLVNQALSSINQYENDHGEWEECVNKEKSKCQQKKPKARGGKFLGFPYEYLRCFNFEQVFGNPILGGLNLVEGVEAIEADTCQEIIPDVLGGAGTVISYPCVEEGGKAATTADGYFATMKDFFGRHIKAEPYTHCLPREELQDSYETNNRQDPDYYVQPMDTTRAGYGCGGILFKTACDTEDGVGANRFFLAGGVNHDQTSPALVKEDVESD